MFKKKAKKYKPDRIQELIDNIRQNYDCGNLSDTETSLQKVAEVGYAKGYRAAEEYCTNVIDNQRKLVDESKNGEKKIIDRLLENGNLFFEDYEGKVSPITCCDVKVDKIIFKE